MTYSRPVSDAMMLDASPATKQNPVAETASNDNSAGSATAGGWSNNSSERTDSHNGDEGTHEPVRQLSDSPTSNGASHASAGGNPPVCQNCGTSTTPLWRRNELGATLCNACGLFLKLHGRARPLNLKTDTIKSRNRVKSVTQPKKKIVYDDKMHTSPRSGQKHMNGHANGYGNGHLRIEQLPKHRPDMVRPPFDHHDLAYSSQPSYSYARSTASSNDSAPDYSPPTGTLTEPPKPYSPFYGAANSPRDYSRGAHTPPYYAHHAHHPVQGPPPLSLPPPTSHAEGGRALPPASSLLRQSPPPRHESPQLPPLYNVEPPRHHASHSRPRSPAIPVQRGSPDHRGVVSVDGFDRLSQSNEQLRGRVIELELVNDLMKSRVSELESAEQRARMQIENLRQEIAQYQSRENDLYRKIDRLKDELVDTYKINNHSRSPSNASRHDIGDTEESAAKRRKVLLSEIVDEKGQLSSVQHTPAASASPPILTASPPAVGAAIQVKPDGHS